MMLKLARYLKQYKIQVILGPIFKLTEAVFELIVPLVMAKIIDTGVKNGDLAYVLKMSGVMALLAIVGLVCALICQYFASVASQGFGTALRSRLFAHICALSSAQTERFTASSLTTRMTNDINQLQVAVAMLIRLVVRAPFLAAGAIIMAMLLDLKLSLIFLAATALIALLLYLLTKITVPAYRAVQKRLDKISQITRENLEGVRVIRAFARQENEKQRFFASNEDFTRASIRVGKLSALLNPLTFVVINFAITAVVWFGARRFNAGTLTQGEIIALVSYLSQTLLAMIVVANLTVLFTKAAASAARILEVLETPASITSHEAPTLPPQNTAGNMPEIQFENVSFSYHNTGENALEQISFTIQKGQTVGIVGGTGAGKSTLVQLIPRFYEIQKGVIHVGGVDLPSYSIKALRAKTGMVPQNARLLSGSIRENLQFGKEDATDADLYRALDIAQAREFVEKMPQKLDTLLHQGGKNLSGGQRQRLTIARALVRQPEILILDDSFSALDYATDASLRTALRRETQDMTTLIVSQRIVTVRDADLILVLDDGKIAGMGTHEQLLSRNEIYREICATQQLYPAKGEKNQ